MKCKDYSEYTVWVCKNCNGVMPMKLYIALNNIAMFNCCPRCGCEIEGKWKDEK